MGFATALTAAASIASGVIGSRSARKAASAQTAGARAAGDTQREFFYQTREDFAPYREEGEAALRRYGDIVLGGDVGKFRESPGYQFRLGEGEKAIRRAASAGGRLFSGRTMKEMGRYASNLASQEYGTYLSQLGKLASIGQASAGQLAQVSPAYASNIGQAQIGEGTARASGYTGSAEAIRGTLADIGGFAGAARSSSYGVPYGAPLWMHGARSVSGTPWR